MHDTATWLRHQYAIIVRERERERERRRERERDRERQTERERESCVRGTCIDPAGTDRIVCLSTRWTRVEY